VLSIKEYKGIPIIPDILIPVGPYWKAVEADDGEAEDNDEYTSKW